MSSKTPERYPVFILTMVELWIACDKSACEVYGLLEDIDVDFPVELLNSLLLPSKSRKGRQRFPSIRKYDKGLPAHYNLLTAKLLVNGQPLARLSTDYTKHSLHDTSIGELISMLCHLRFQGCNFLPRGHMLVTISI